MSERRRPFPWTGFRSFLSPALKFGALALLLALLVWPFSGHPAVPFAFGALLWSIAVWFVSARMLQIEALKSDVPRSASALAAYLVFAVLLVVVLLLAIGR